MAVAPPDTFGERLLPVAGAGQSAREVGRLLWGCRWSAAAALALTFAGAALSLVPVLLLSDVIDALGERDGPANLGRIAVLALAAVAGTAVVAGTAEGLLGDVTARVVAGLRERAAAATLDLPPATVAAAGRGDLLGRVGADVAVLVTGARTTVPSILGASILVVTATAGIAGVDWRLAVAGLSCLPFYVCALRWYLPRSAPLYRRQRALEGSVIGTLMDSVDGRRTVRTHGLVDDRRKATVDVAAASRHTSIAAFRTFSGLVGRANLAEFVGLGTLTVTGWLLLRHGAVSVGDVAAALILFHRQFVPIGAILFSFDEAQRSGAALTRIVGLISTTGGHPPAPLPQAPPMSPMSVSITDLHHTYPTGQRALAGVGLEVPAGRSTALVGGSGAGKSTVAGILAGTVVHTGEGSVRIGGKDVDALDPADRRGLVCVASQTNHVFATTVRENLAMAKPLATESELIAALELVGAGRWFAGLPAGLGTQIGDGGVAVDATLAQRLALARIALSPAPVVVLDESTAEEEPSDASYRDASADEAPQLSLEEAATRAVRGRTAVIIAHRLSHAAAADQIVVMDHGRVTEAGTHDALLARGGRYAELWLAWRGE